MSKRSFRIGLAIVVGTIAIAAIVGAVVIKKALSYPSQRNAGVGKEVIVPIERGMTFPQIARRLHEKGVVENPRWFRLYAMHRGVTTKVRDGDYVLSDDMTPEEVIDKLLQGVQDVTIDVTIPEGKHFLEVAELLEEKGVVSADNKGELERLSRDPKFLGKHGIVGDSIEGYLFPETYKFKVPSAPDKVLDTLVKHHHVVWERVRNKHPKGVKKLRDKLGWSDRDILTMASIVEKEAVVQAERATIAQVFINRLVSSSFKPKRLETDPTIRYGCMVPATKSAACKAWDKTQRLRTKQLRDKDNPYNTYQHEGLPPGPICSPGEASLEATVNPDGTNFFFFVARKDKRSHVFSRTLQEHERAVDKYQR
jgi:UPF0755 protein